MTTATELPLLAMLGKGAGAPGKPLAPLGDDDRALDAALEFAALLLDAGVAGDAPGKGLPGADGKTLPAEQAPSDPDAPLADAVPSDVLEPIVRRELPAALGNAVADEIRNAQGQPAVLQPVAPGTRVTETRPGAGAPAAALSVMPGLAPAVEAAPAPTAADAEPTSPAGARQAIPAAARQAAQGVPANALGAQARNAAPATAPGEGIDADGAPLRIAADAAETADAGARRERAAADTPPALGALARTEAVRRTARTVADPTRRALDAVSALRAEPLAGAAAAPNGEGGAVTRMPSAAVPQLAGPDVMLGETGWTRQFAERVGWVIHARVPQAQLSLNPEHLGPIEMAIEVEDAKARVQFTAAHAVTREAIEQSLPRLREMLEQQGLDLAQADVGADPNTPRGDGAGDADLERDPETAPALAAERDGDDAAARGEPAGSVLRLRARGLVDTFV